MARPTTRPARPEVTTIGSTAGVMEMTRPGFCGGGVGWIHVPSGETTVADLLIVDDDADATHVLARLLRGEGHVVRCAADAGAALRCLSEREPDLVLLDLGLPRVFGLDLLDAVRDDGRF